MIKRKSGCLLLALLLLSMMFNPQSRASELEVQQAESQVEENKRQVEEAEKLLEDLQSQQSDLNAYLSQLNSAITQKQSEVDALQAQVSEKKTEIADTELALSQAQAQSEHQYEMMKLRIQYMYEAGMDDYLDLFFSAGSISELLGSAEYISQISEYDRTMLNEYQELQESIALSRAELENQQASLESLLAESEADKAGLDVLIAAQNQELEEVANRIAQAQQSVQDNEEDLEASEELLVYLEAELERQMQEALREAQRQAEEASRAAAEEASRVASSEAAANQGGSQGSSGAGSGESGTSAQTPENAALVLTWPLPSSHRITSYFGPRPNQPVEGTALFHNGIDIAAPKGTDIVAAADGTVYYVGDGTETLSTAGGNQVWIIHDDGTCTTTYMHCSEWCVSVGQHVTAGTVIAKVGSTGLSTGNHLDFRIIYNGTFIDPLGSMVTYR